MSAYLQASTTHVWSLVGQTPLVWVTPQRDIEAQLAEIYGIEVSAQTVSTITNKVLPLMFGQS
jgi:hypothetical protein